MKTQHIDFEQKKKQLCDDIMNSKSRKAVKKTIDFYFKVSDFWKEVI